jgi:hypothetical protein
LIGLKPSLFVIIALLLGYSANGQQRKKVKTADQAVVTYGLRSNGKELSSGKLKLYFKKSLARLASDRQKEIQFLDFKEHASLQILTLENGERFTLKTPFDKYNKPEFLPDTTTILGFPCKKVKLNIRSNTIEVWYTEGLAVKGSPALNIVPDLGLVLKVVRNGNFETIAENIEFRAIKDEEITMPADIGLIVDDETYTQKTIESRFVSIPVFNQEQLNFGDQITNPGPDQANVTYRYSSGTVILKKVKLPDLKANVFAELSQYSNGDAYDRTGSLFIIPTNQQVTFLDALQKGIEKLPVYKSNNSSYQGVVATENYSPPLELMRFYTSFGVRHFNQDVKIKGYQWADSTIFKQDITEFLPVLKDEVWIGVYIGNYDKGGHKVSLKINYYPEGRSDGEERHYIQPIFNTTNIMEMSGQNYGSMFKNDSLTVTVNIPEGLKSLSLRYTSTGHGGWGGGDEFNPKLNEIFIDGEKSYSFIPWRTDCASYRLFNPASGNFGNGLSSSDLSRSNWCPATVTYPVNIPLDNLKPGKHTFKVAIPIGEPAGSSFSYWNVSGTLIGAFK